MTKAVKKIKTTIEDNSKAVELPKPNILPEEDVVEPFSNATDSLMPELEELVKKNPNRLIGCGG